MAFCKSVIASSAGASTSQLNAKSIMKYTVGDGSNAIGWWVLASAYNILPANYACFTSRRKCLQRIRFEVEFFTIPTFQAAASLLVRLPCFKLYYVLYYVLYYYSRCTLHFWQESFGKPKTQSDYAIMFDASQHQPPTTCCCADSLNISTISGLHEPLNNVFCFQKCMTPWCCFHVVVWQLHVAPVDLKSKRVALEGPAQHVPAVTTESDEWFAPAVLRLAWCKTFCHRVDPSEPARFFIVSSFSMLQANSVSKFLLGANFWANSWSEQIWFLSAVFLYCEQIFFALNNLCVDRNCVMRPYLDCK